MKLQLIRDESEKIEGYKSVLSTSFMPPNMDDVIDNSCESVSLGDVLDLYDSQTRNNVLMAVLKKLRINGEVFLSGTEPRALCKMYVNNILSTENFSANLSITNSALELDQAVSLFQKIGLSVETSTLNGYKYEIRARRSN
jgi:hypothetical protein